MPKKGRGEAARMGRHLNLSSTMMSQILSGIKVLTLEQGHAIGEYLVLGTLEIEYLIDLIQRERAGTIQLKKYFEKRLEDIRNRSLQLSKRLPKSHSLTQEEKAVFYSSPLYSILRLFTSTSPDGKTLTEILEVFPISIQQAQEYLDFLTSTGLCHFKNGRYSMGLQSTHIDSHSPFVRVHHSNWRIKSIERMASPMDKELFYTAPVSLSEEDFLKLRERMVLFIKDFISTIHDSSPEKVACFNIDFFIVK